MFIQLPWDGLVYVGKVIHGEKEDFWIDHTAEEEWSWQQMLSHLTQDSLRYVVQGPEGNSTGIVGCTVEPHPGGYDHKSQVQVTHKQRLPCIDFVIWRNDGSRLYMHPSWTKTKIDCHEGIPNRPAQVPKAGVGKSDGPGTFTRMVRAQYPTKLSFRKSLLRS